MQSKYKKKIYLFLPIFLLSFTLLAQQDKEDECQENYKEASKLYQEGKLDDALKKVETCLDDPKGLPARLKADIYRLAARIHILLDKDEQAGTYIRRMLEVNPNYRVQADDLAQFRASLDTLNVLPRLSVGFRVSRSQAYIQPTESFSVFSRTDDPNYNEGSYTSNSGYQLALTGTWGLSTSLSLKAELGYKQINFSYENGGGWISEKRFSTDTISFQQSYRQSSAYWSLPISFVYAFKPQSKYYPFIEAGGYLRLLNTSVRTSKMEFSSTERDDFFLYEGITELSELLENFQYGVFFGTGITRNLRFMRISLDLRYCHPLNDAENPDNRFNNQIEGIHDQIFEYYKILDEFRIRNFEIGLTLAYNFKYKSLKRTTNFTPIKGL